jgi:hypothetical protein
MRAMALTLILTFATAALRAQTAPAPEAPEPEIVPIPASTMSELMVKVVYPTSDAVLYVSSRTPTNEQEWNDLQGKALMLAESANLLLMPQRALDQGQWLEDTKLMLDAGIAAYEAAMAKDLDKLIELNEPLYQSCVVCHLHYRPDYLKDARLKLEDPPD